MIPRLLIAAPGSGSGKTLVTCGLLRLFQKKGFRPAAFKCGPDYIDPMFHESVLGVPSRNLDTFFSCLDGDEVWCPKGAKKTGIRSKNLQRGGDADRAPENSCAAGPEKKAAGREDVTDILCRSVRKNHADVAVIEGVMGYFDGTGPSGMEASSCDLALQTQTPVLLVVDAKGMGRSVVPLVKGFADYGENRGQEEYADSCHYGGEHAEQKRRCRESAGEDRHRQQEMAPARGRIGAVLLNRVSAGMYPLMKGWIEEETGLPVVGCLPQDPSLAWESRHLGLFLPGEIRDLQNRIDRLAARLEETLDFDLLMKIAQSAVPLEKSEKHRRYDIFYSGACAAGVPGTCDRIGETRSGLDTGTEQAKAAGKGLSPRIAVARDEAFCFYYEDNLELLQECGAELVFFSPLHDPVIPDADGLLLGGGYPELHAEELSGNEAMKAQIRALAAAGTPILAECGGFMYLQEYLETPDRETPDRETLDRETPDREITDRETLDREITDRETADRETADRETAQDRDKPERDRLLPMCGVLPGTCRKAERLVRFGYLELENRMGRAAIPLSAAGADIASSEGPHVADSGDTGYLPAGHRIRGHEFHYYDSSENGEACTARKPGRDRVWNCMVVQGNIMAGFPHLYYRSDPAFAQAFVDRCRCHHTQFYA